MIERLSLPNPYYPQEKKANAELAQPERARDQAILHAYNDIVQEVRWVLSKQPIRANQRSIDYSHPFQLAGKSFIKDFVCPFCAVTLNLVGDRYIITMSIDQRSLAVGTGMASNALIRIAFVHTMNGTSNFTIEDALHIQMLDNADEYFKRREAMYEGEKGIWFSK